MIIKCEIIKSGPVSEDILDYNRLVFKVNFEKNINSNNTKFVTLFLDTLIAGGARKILVDMKDAEFIDSSGIGIFISTAKKIRSEKGEIAFVNVPDQLTEIFRVVRLDEYIKMFNSRESALKFLG